MKKLDLAQMEQIEGGSELGCALAIAGTLATTVGAIWVTGGAALAVWLVSKSIATASVIESCSDL